jgi:hypothetical protein
VSLWQKLVADAVNRDEMPGLVGILFNFVPYFANVSVHCSGVGIILVTPNGVE